MEKKRKRLSFRVDPIAKGGLKSAFTWTVYSDGTIVTAESKPFSMEAPISGTVLALKDVTLVKKLNDCFDSFLPRLEALPFDLTISEIPSNSFTLELDGLCLSGSMVEIAEKDIPLIPMLTPSKELSKKAKGNRTVIALFNKFREILEKSNGVVMSHSSLLYSVGPVFSYLRFLCLEKSNDKIALCHSLEECYKRAGKKAFDGNISEPSKYNQGLLLLRQNAVKILKGAKTMEEFDASFAALTQQLMGIYGDSLSYARAAYWIDLSYINLLLAELLPMDERKVAYLHIPSNPVDVKELEGNEDKSGYDLFLFESRRELSPLHMSPAYVYLEGLYRKAHPEAIDKNREVGQA